MKTMDTRGGQSSRVMSSAAAVHAGGGLLVGGGTTYAVAGAAVACSDGVTMDSAVHEGLHHHGRSSETEVGRNQRDSMAFDSAKGLLNPAGENNCFLNSAVQVCRVR